MLAHIHAHAYTPHAAGTAKRSYSVPRHVTTCGTRTSGLQEVMAESEVF